MADEGKEFMSMNDDDRYEDALRKKELKNKRHCDLYAQSQQEKNMQQPQSDCNSTFLVDENTMCRNRRRREVSATKTKQLAHEIQGDNIQIRQRKSMRFVGVSSAPSAFDHDVTVEDGQLPTCGVVSKSPECTDFYQSMTCRKTMCAQPKLIPDISPGQSSWTTKVVVVEKNIARTAQRSPVKYQTMVLVDPQAAANIERLDEIVSQKSYLESSMFVKVCPPAKHKICKIKDIPVLLSEDKQSFIQAIRTSVDEEQILYVRATGRDAEGTIVKSAANNIVKSQPKHISRINKGKQIVKPVQRALFSLKDSDISQGEEDGMPSATAIFNHSSRDRVSTIVTSSSEEDNVPPSNK
ncbi:Uncharacterized protein Fot_37404 [Forsythia ovata]|uniref:Uncharacterized protein n=1 Tax=Forsythia ovata TaxID=205694 RepID=A0ABD1RYW8_9LAMI